LMKLLVNVVTTTTVVPEAVKFFYVADATTAGGATLTIDAADFFDDLGAAVTTLPPLNPDNGYFSVYVNGVLQMQDISTYTPGATGVGSLAIAVPAGTDSILEDTPVVLEIVNFTPDSSSVVET